MVINNYSIYPYVRVKIPVDKSQREYMELKQTVNNVTIKRHKNHS